VNVKILYCGFNSAGVKSGVISQKTVIFNETSLKTSRHVFFIVHTKP
jgi:hypothetical protein